MEDGLAALALQVLVAGFDQTAAVVAEFLADLLVSVGLLFEGGQQRGVRGVERRQLTDVADADTRRLVG